MSTNTTPVTSRSASPVQELEVQNTGNSVNELVGSMVQMHLQEPMADVNNVQTLLTERTVVQMPEISLDEISSEDSALLSQAQKVDVMVERRWYNPNCVCCVDGATRGEKLATWIATPRGDGDVRITDKQTNTVNDFATRLIKIQNSSSKPCAFVFYEDRPDHAVEEISQTYHVQNDPKASYDPIDKHSFLYFQQQNQQRFVVLEPGMMAFAVTKAHQIAFSARTAFQNNGIWESGAAIWQNRIVACPHNKVVHLTVGDKRVEQVNA